MFLKRLEKLASDNGMTPERALRDLCEKRHLSCGQVAKDMKCPKREVQFWADAFGVAVVDYAPKIIQAARERGSSLRDYFLSNFAKGVGWMAQDLGVAFTTVEEYYAVFTDGETWRMEHERGRRCKA